MIALYVIVGLILGVILGYLIRVMYSRANLSSIEATARKILDDAKIQAETKRKEALLEVKDLMEQQRREFNQETKERKQELVVFERRLNQKEENIERKIDILEKKEKEIQIRERNVKASEQKINEEMEGINKTREEQRHILEKIAGFTQEEAKRMLLQTYEEEVRKEAAMIARSIEQEARETAEKKAKEVLSLAIQRVAAEHTVDNSTTTISIPNDELKGRVIGREGRNIRAFEQATGVDLIVDDTPETITISAFDSIRREIARIAMEKLLADGRIHPSRIEEVVNKVKEEMDSMCKEIGEKAALEVGIVGLNPEILTLLGKLKFRTSYGQNQLQHTLEVAWLASAIAGEIGADIAFCKRAALLHDIGKSVNQSVEGTHHQISADLAKKYGESAKMVNAILSHHEGVAQPESVEAFIVAAADAISASRPGARRESVEHYLKRIEKIEKIATSFKGIVSAYAVQAGREMRVMVEPEEIDDKNAYFLAKNIAKKVEQELEYPGQIKITVIREVRAQEIAK